MHFLSVLVGLSIPDWEERRTSRRTPSTTLREESSRSQRTAQVFRRPWKRAQSGRHGVGCTLAEWGNARDAHGRQRENVAASQFDTRRRGLSGLPRRRGWFVLHRITRDVSEQSHWKLRRAPTVRVRRCGGRRRRTRSMSVDCVAGMCLFVCFCACLLRFAFVPALPPDCFLERAAVVPLPFLLPLPPFDNYCRCCSFFFFCRRGDLRRLRAVGGFAS